MTDLDIQRAKRIIEQTITQLDVDLSGYTILTEVGSNLFAYTPIIAALCKASKVYAWTGDSAYGKASSNVDVCKKIMKSFDIPNIIEFAENERPDQHIKNADIITNLGFVRPLNETFFKLIKPNAVITAMCEAWEVREQDIDLAYCKQNNILVAGTWENYPPLEIFNFCGPLAIKMAQEGGYEVFKNRILVWSEDMFGKTISAAFKNFGASKVISTTNVNVLYENANDIDFVFLCDYHQQNTLLGENGIINALKIKELNPACSFIHLYGKLDSNWLDSHKVSHYPKKNGFQSTMSFTLSHLGPLPILNLHIAGLKVAECLKKGITHKIIQKIC